MTIIERSGGFGVRLYVARGSAKWIGTFPTRALAEQAQARASVSGSLEQLREEARRLHAEQLSQTAKAGRQRAVAMFVAEPCEVCGAEDIDRHHRDGDPTNNVRDNIVFLCHRHHRGAHSLGGRTLLADALRVAEGATSLDEVRRIVNAARRATEKLHPATWGQA